MTDKWNGKQRSDAEFMPKPDPVKPPPEKEIPRHKSKSVFDGFDYVPEDILRHYGANYRYSDPRRDLDYRPRYSRQMGFGTSAKEAREMQREWERSGGKITRDYERDLQYKYDTMMRYMTVPIWKDEGKVIGQRIMLYGASGEVACSLIVPTERQSKLGELFDKVAQVPGYMHWWAESDPARLEQTKEAAKEIAGSLRWDADYWRSAYPEEYEYAAWLAQSIVVNETTKIKVETVRTPSSGMNGILGASIVS